MRKINFNIKDRKVLTLGLCLILVCVFTLTIAYAALNAVLTISGSAQVTSANWDIHLANPKVTNGSTTTAVPSITSGKTLNFSTTLTTPGDFYEFTVDVVNGGSIDAMIDKVTKTPELTADQLKYLKYEVSYANGESISSKQNIASGVTMPIKVRVEYRKDLAASDLPSGTVQLTLGLVLDYVQSDGTGTTVKDNGVYKLVSANGSLDAIGTIVTIADQQFYTIGTEGNNVKLLSMMNITLEERPTQSSNASPTAFATSTQHGTYYTDYDGSLVQIYVNNYKNKLESECGINIEVARLISYDELTYEKIGCNGEELMCSEVPSFITETTYWTGSANSSQDIWTVYNNNEFFPNFYFINDIGVRPVIIISKDNFN